MVTAQVAGNAVADDEVVSNSQPVIAVLVFVLQMSGVNTLDAACAGGRVMDDDVLPVASGHARLPRIAKRNLRHRDNRRRDLRRFGYGKTLTAVPHWLWRIHDLALAAADADPEDRDEAQHPRTKLTHAVLHEQQGQQTETRPQRREPRETGHLYAMTVNRKAGRTVVR